MARRHRPRARDVGEPFDSDPVRLNRHPLRRLDMYGMKSLLSAFDVKADRIDRRVGAGQHVGNPPLVSNVGLDRLKTRIVGTEEFATAVRIKRKTRACGDVERRGGRESRFHRKR